MKDIDEIYNESILAGRRSIVAQNTTNAQAELDLPQIAQWFRENNVRITVYGKEWGHGQAASDDGTSFILINQKYSTVKQLQFVTDPKVRISSCVIRYEDEGKELDYMFKGLTLEDLSMLEFLKDAKIHNLSFYDCSFNSLKGLDIHNISGRFLVKNCNNLQSLEGAPKNAKFVTVIGSGDKHFDYTDIKKYCNVSKNNCIWG